jgi:hypothetical protein
LIGAYLDVRRGDGYPRSRRGDVAAPAGRFGSERAKGRLRLEPVPLEAVDSSGFGGICQRLGVTYMHVEMTRTFPVARKKAYDYLSDFTTWPAWYVGVLEIIDPDTAAWEKPGDQVRYYYRMLGRRIESVNTLEELREAEFVRFTAKSPVAEVHFEWTYTDAGEDTFSANVIMETNEPTNFFGRIIDKMVIPRMLERDLKHTFDNVEEMFAVGIPE